MAGERFSLSPGTTLAYPRFREAVPLLVGTWGRATAAWAGSVADELKIGGSANPELVPVVREWLGNREVGSCWAASASSTRTETGRASARGPAVAPYVEVVARLDPTVDASAPLPLDRFSHRRDAGGGRGAGRGALGGGCGSRRARNAAGQDDTGGSRADLRPRPPAAPALSLRARGTPGPPATSPRYDRGVSQAPPSTRVGAAVRAEFPIFETATYLNSCSQGALSHRVRDAVEGWLAGWDENGAEWDFWVERNEAFRAAIARLLHASADDVAVTTSVSQGVSGLVSALDLDGERNRIVISEYEFPTVGQIAHAQELRGAEVVHVRPDADGSIPAGALRRGDRRADGARLLHDALLPLRAPARRGGDRRGGARRRGARAGRQLPGLRRGRAGRPLARRRRGDRRDGQVPARHRRPRVHVGEAGGARGARSDPDGLVRGRGHLRDVDRRLLAARERAAVRRGDAAGAVALRGCRRHLARRGGGRAGDRGARRAGSSTACSTGSTRSGRRWPHRATRPARAARVRPRDRRRRARRRARAARIVVSSREDKLRVALHLYNVEDDVDGCSRRSPATARCSPDLVFAAVRDHRGRS